MIASDGALSATQAVTITVTNVNEAPTISSGASASFAENATGTVYTTVAADVDAGTTLTYSLSGADASKFSISNAGLVTFNTSPNFEAPASAASSNVYSINVIASDGALSATQAVAITVTDVNEAPTNVNEAPTMLFIDGASMTTTITIGSAGQTMTTQTILPVPLGSGGADGLADVPLALDGSSNPTLQLGLPGGVGVRINTVSGGTQDSDSRIVSALGSISAADAELLGTVMNAIGSTFGATQRANLVMRSIILTVADGTLLGQPIRISGSAGVNEVLIIDTRNLPHGAVLDLSNVEFAIIIGPATLTGGLGQNFVVGDGYSQLIVLGPDDDVLRGGGGDDTIGSKGGNDKLYGDEGNDTLVGGLGIHLRRRRWR